MKIDVIAHADGFYMGLTAQSIGLSGEALRKFRNAVSSLKITLEVNELTGESEIIALDGHQVSA